MSKLYVLFIKIILYIVTLRIRFFRVRLHLPTVNSTLNSPVMKQLETYKKWCKQKLLLYGLKLMDEDEYENDDTFVFISHLSGKPKAPNNTAKIKYKIIQRTRLPKIILHDLRHT